MGTGGARWIFNRQLVEAIRQELQGQRESSAGRLTIADHADGGCYVQGPVDLDALAMVVVSAVAGGP